MKIPTVDTLDIHEHLDTLYRYSRGLKHITEMGFRTGVSFTAFLMAQPETLVTYDLVIPKEWVEHFSKINCKTNLIMNQASTLDIEIEETDLLFIDTLHTYDQLSKELEKHGNKSRKYIILHDTETFGIVSEDGTKPGLKQAVLEFQKKYPVWYVIEQFSNNNGLTVLRRA